MILIAVCLLAAFPPGFLFPQMAMSRKKRRAAAARETTQENDTQTVDTEGEKSETTAKALGSGDLEAGTTRASRDETFQEN